MENSSVLGSAEIWGLILALIALFVGILHVKEIRKVMREAKDQREEAKSHTIELKNQAAELKSQAAELKNQTAVLDEVKQSVSTRFLGQFPDYFPHIVNLLKEAKHKIIIFCDFPAYGSFSAPDTWFFYNQILEENIRIREDVDVEITCLDGERRSEYIKEQFFKPGLEWDEWKRNSNDKLQDFFQAHNKRINIDQLTKADFLKILEEAEQQTLQETFGTQYQETNIHMPLYFWIIDGTRAVFAIPSLSERAIEYGFSTTDQKLIQAFEDMRELYNRGIPPTTNPAKDTVLR